MKTSLPNTMIFFDEVQKCPEVITWIRFLVDDVVHASLMKMVHLYLVVGRMPAAVQAYLDTK